MSRSGRSLTGYEDYLTRGHPMSSELHRYTRDEFLAEFYPDPADKAAIAAGMEQLRAEQRAFRLAKMRRRLGITQAQVAARMGITQGRVSAIEHAKRAPPNCAPWLPTSKPSVAA
jgi:DNA-binding XRE family transcriptional regulator